METRGNERREIVKDEHQKEGEESEFVDPNIPEWKKQITVRGVIVSSLIGGIYSFMVLKQGLTTGIIPNLTLSTARFAYLCTTGWTKILHKFGVVVAPFTRQENTMIQTCAVACYSIAVGGGLWSSLLGLDKKTYEKTGINTPGNSPGSYKDPGMVWMTTFLLVTSFIGIFVLIPLTKILIVDYKLTFPSGMATAVLINGFHDRGNKMANDDFQQKQGLTTGIIPNLTLSTALFAYLCTTGWTKILHKFGIIVAPFTRQENTMIQTCAVACYSIAVGGGLWSSLLGLDKKTYEKTGINTPGNSPGSYKDPGMVWMTTFLLVTSFIGIFVLIPLSKILIVDYKLTFPSGMATAVLINGFHDRGNKMAKKQVRGFMKFMSISFFWAFFQWFYTGDPGCGFSHFPTFGLQAWKHSFYFDFSMTMVGTGMLLPHIVNFSTLLGAVFSWGFLWPVMRKLKGKWYPADLPETSMKSLNGYMIFISIALLLGDGIYYFIKIICVTLLSMHRRFTKRNIILEEAAIIRSSDEPKQNQVFTSETIPTSVGVSGYILFAATTAVAVPLMFPAVKWYHVIITYMLAPILAFCNAYGAGLTDINMAYSYSKVGLFAMAAVGGENHGVVAGLVGCGIIKSVISVSCILMQDMKTGHLTLTSPRAMLVSQAIGTAIGCVVSPLILILFYKTFDVGNPNGEYKAPYALIYRNIAILGVEGVSALPRNCLELCYGFFAFAIGINLVKDIGPKKLGKWLPMPMAMAVTFPVGAYFAIDLFVGSLVVFVWGKLKLGGIEFMVQAVASGLICGEGLWIVPATVLSLAKINPPMCMRFMPT